MPAGNKRRTSEYGVCQNSDHILTINKKCIWNTYANNKTIEMIRCFGSYKVTYHNGSYFVIPTMTKFYNFI